MCAEELGHAALGAQASVDVVDPVKCSIFSSQIFCKTPFSIMNFIIQMHVGMLY